MTSCLATFIILIYVTRKNVQNQINNWQNKIENDMDHLRSSTCIVIHTTAYIVYAVFVDLHRRTQLRCCSFIVLCSLLLCMVSVQAFNALLTDSMQEIFYTVYFSQRSSRWLFRNLFTICTSSIVNHVDDWLALDQWIIPPRYTHLMHKLGKFKCNFDSLICTVYILSQGDKINLLLAFVNTSNL